MSDRRSVGPRKARLLILSLLALSAVMCPAQDAAAFGAGDLPEISLANMSATARRPSEASYNILEAAGRLTGAVSDDDSVDASAIEISIDSSTGFGPVTWTGPSGARVAFEHDLSSLTDGVHFLHLRAGDLASAKKGETVAYGTLGPVYFVIDTQGPEVSVTSPAAGSKTYTELPVTGRAADVDGLKDRDLNGTPEIEVSVDGGPSVLRDVRDGKWSYTVPVAVDGSWDGEHELSIRVTDVYGQQRVLVFRFWVE